MENKRIFKKHYSRLAWEGVIKALVCGFITGFLASIIPAVITIVYNYNGVLICIGTCLVVALASTPLFYLLFRPTIKKVAQRVDRLGLEERLITMLELEKDQSYMAMRQREDAKEKLMTVDRRRIKFSIFIIPVIALALAAACSITTMTISATSVEGMMKWRSNDQRGEPWEIEEKEYQYLSLTYLASKGGYIDSNAEQLVPFGEDGLEVVPVAEDGYVFAGWEDGVTTLYRTDRKVTESLKVTANFVEVGPQGDNKSDSEKNQDGDEYVEINNIINNQEYYGDTFDERYAAAMEELLASDSLTPEQRAMIELYFELMNRGK